MNLLARQGRSKSSSPEKPKPSSNKASNKLHSKGGEAADKKSLVEMLLESQATTSPRRVLDLDMVTEESDSNDENDRPLETGESAERVLFPAVEEENGSVSGQMMIIHPSLDMYGNFAKPKRSKKISTIAPLPTLSEASM